MKPRHQVSRQAVDLIKTFEGFRERAAQLADGRWTIGYGHTLSAREGAVITEADAEALLLYDMITTAHAVNEHLYTPLNQNQFDALVSFAFNIGGDNFRRSSTLRRLNEGQLLQAACAMELWRKADFEGERIVIDALVRRRAAEKTLFLTPIDGWVPAPSPILPPKVDYDASYQIPVQTPTELVSDLNGASATAERVASPPREDTQTASERAAANVAARLAAILPEDKPVEDDVTPPTDTFEIPPEPVNAAPPAIAPEPETVVEPAAEPTPEPTPEPVFELTSPDAVADPLPEPEPAPEQDTETFELPIIDVSDTPSTALPAAAAAEPRIVASDREFAAANVPGPTRLGPTLLIVLALFSIALFAGAVVFGFNVGPQDDGGPLTPKTLGWILAVVAVACFGGAAFFLLDQVGGKDDEPKV